MLSLPDGLLLANAAATFWMAGLIAFVHRVHYPMFDRYGREECAQTMLAHQSRTGPVVGPAMLVELLTGVALPFALPIGVAAWQAWLGVALIAAWAVSTACFQIPMHRRLSLGFDADAHRRLVATNRWRALAWMARAALVAWMLAERLATTRPQ